MIERLLPEQNINENRDRGNRLVRYLYLVLWFSLTLIIFPIRSVIALFTEFLPSISASLLSRQLEQLFNNFRSDDISERVFHSTRQLLSYVIRIIIYSFLFGLARWLHMLGSVITSPITAYEHAHHFISTSRELGKFAAVLAICSMATVWLPIIFIFLGILLPVASSAIIFKILSIVGIAHGIVALGAGILNSFKSLYIFHRIRVGYFENLQKIVISFNQNIANLKEEMNPTIVIEDPIIINYATAQILKDTVKGSDSRILTLTLYTEMANNPHVLKFPLPARNQDSLIAESMAFNCTTEALCTIDQALRQTIGEKLFFLAVALTRLYTDNNLSVLILKYVIPNSDQSYLAAVVKRAKQPVGNRDSMFFQPVLINDDPGRDQTDKVTIVDDDDLLQPLLNS